MDDAEERLKAVLTPEFDRRLKELMTSAKSKNDIRSVSNEVTEAIVSLYGAFSRYSMSDPFDFCDHCVSAEELDAIRDTPLHELTFDQLWTISSNIVLTIGGVSDFKYFLPRLIEGSRYGASYNIEAVFTRFRNTEFETWPSAERQAVQGYIRNQFEENATSVVERSDGPTDMDDLLCCAYYAGTLPELLGQWTSDTRETARQQLLEWALSAFGLPGDPYAFIDGPPAPIKPVNAYYDAPGRGILLAWLETPEAQRALSEACALRADLPAERRGRLERILSAGRHSL
jgi:hypothetical protein